MLLGKKSTIIVFLSHLMVLFWCYIFYASGNYKYAFWGLFLMVVLDTLIPFFNWIDKKMEENKLG